MSIVVRPPRLEDVDRLAVVNVETWRDAYTGIIIQERLDTMELDEYRDRWRSNVTDPPDERIFRVAEVKGEVAAYGIGGPYRPQDEDDETPETATLAELYALYTHPDFQDRGIGLAVHDVVLDEFVQHGYDAAALWVLRDNVRARRWYERRGWRLDGATSSWVAIDVPHPEVRLRRSLADAAPAGAG